MKNIALLILHFCLISSTVVFGQGVISGTVLDESTGETVIGASVVELSTGAITITDFDGKYQFELEPGVYSLKFSYIGFPDVTVEGIEVKDGEVTYQDIAMDDSEGVSLEELGVVVSAERITNSEVATLVQRKESVVVSDNIGAQEMARYGASDAGGALKKVTGTSVEGGKYVFVRGLGDRYSLVQLNGLTIPSTDPYRNSAQLDLIPTNLIDNISTAKTSSPDQPGNFTGGNVNITTKKFPEIETFTISFSGGYNSQSNLISNFLTQGSIGDDYFGFDSRRTISGVLVDPEIRPLINERSETLARRFGNEEAAAALDLSSRSVIPQVAPNETNSFLDHGITLSYGNRLDFGKNKLGIIATASFRQDYQNLDNVLVGNWEVDPSQPDSLDNFGAFVVNQSTLNPTLSGLIGLTYRIGNNNEIGILSMYNHTAETKSLTSLGERPDNAFFPRLLEGFAQNLV